MERAGTGDAGGSGGAAGRGQPLVAGAAAPECDRVRRTPVSQNFGPSGRNKESGSGAGTSALELLKLYLRYRSVAKVSGRDPFCEENRGQAGHILPSPWGPFGSAVVAGPRCGLRAPLDRSCPSEPCGTDAASRCPGHMGLSLLVLLCPLVLPTSSKSMDGKRQGGLEPAWSIEKGKFLCQCWMLFLLSGGTVQTFGSALAVRLPCCRFAQMCSLFCPSNFVWAVFVDFLFLLYPEHIIDWSKLCRNTRCVSSRCTDPPAVYKQHRFRDLKNK